MKTSETWISSRCFLFYDLMLFFFYCIYVFNDHTFSLWYTGLRVRPHKFTEMTQLVWYNVSGSHQQSERLWNWFNYIHQCVNWNQIIPWEYHSWMIQCHVHVSSCRWRCGVLLVKCHQTQHLEEGIVVAWNHKKLKTQVHHVSSLGTGFQVQHRVRLRMLKGFHKISPEYLITVLFYLHNMWLLPWNINL